MALAHLRSAATRAFICRASNSARPVAPKVRVSNRRGAMACAHTSAAASLNEADVGGGGDGCGMMWCKRCAGEGVLVSLTKAQKRARKTADGSLTAPPKPGKSLPCKECGGVGLDITLDGELPPANVSSPCVAIVGAGIGGAALALALQQRGIYVQLFDKDASFKSRKQGYGLTMQKYSGGSALGALGVKLDGVGSNANVSLSADGRELGRYGHSTLSGVSSDEGAGAATSESGRNVHLPRQALRKALLEKLAPGTARWGMKFERYDEVLVHGSNPINSSRSITLSFSNGLTEGPFDLLVGADGIFSRVRRQKMGDAFAGESTGSESMKNETSKTETESKKDPHPLRYLGVLVVLGICRGNDHPLSQHKVFQIVDGTTRMYAMPFTKSTDGDGCLQGDGFEEEIKENSDHGAMMWQLSFPVDESTAGSLASGDPELLLKEAIKRCGHWPEPVPDLLNKTIAANVAGYPAFDRAPLDPGSLRDENENDFESRVTLVGDAAHPMSPFKGQGANQALLDAVQLARVLFRTRQFEPKDVERRHGCARLFDSDDNKSDVAVALSFFEKQMCLRSEEKVRRSRDAAQYLHSPAALAEGNCVRAHAAADKVMEDQLEGISE